ASPRASSIRTRPRPIFWPARSPARHVDEFRMRAVLDHVGIAVKDLGAALAFYRDALGLDVEPAEHVESQRVRAHFVPTGASSLELLEATAPDSAIARCVAKPLWEQKAAPDARNRISLAMRPLLVRGARTMIIDAGIGDKEGARFADIYGVDRSRNLDHTLAEAGVAPDDVDIVVASHLHFDHAGGFTTRDASGRIRPRFPRAQYIVRRGEWEDVKHPTDRNRASHLMDNYVPF